MFSHAVMGYYVHVKYVSNRLNCQEGGSRQCLFCRQTIGPRGKNKRCSQKVLTQEIYLLSHYTVEVAEPDLCLTGQLTIGDLNGWIDGSISCW